MGMKEEAGEKMSVFVVAVKWTIVSVVESRRELV